MKIDHEQITERCSVWDAAAELVNPIIAIHGLEKYNLTSNPFVVTSTYTAVDQHIEHILKVAEWLLEDHENHTDK